MQPYLDEARELNKKYGQAITGEEKRTVMVGYSKLSNILTKNSVEKFNLSRARIAANSIQR